MDTQLRWAVFWGLKTKRLLQVPPGLEELLQELLQERLEECSEEPSQEPSQEPLLQELLQKPRCLEELLQERLEEHLQESLVFSDGHDVCVCQTKSHQVRLEAPSFVVCWKSVLEDFSCAGRFLPCWKMVEMFLMLFAPLSEWK